MPEFQAAYREARREAMRQTTARLQEASGEAVESLRQIQRAGESESARGIGGQAGGMQGVALRGVITLAARTPGK